MTPAVTLDPLIAVLTAMIAPAVLIGACGSLIISTGNRLGRVVDHVRAVTTRYKTLLDEGKGELYAAQEKQLILRQIPQLTRRAHLLHRSLAAFYVAVGLFVLTSIMIGVSELGAWPDEGRGVAGWATGLAPLLLGLAGVVMLSYGSGLLVVEARLALRTTMRETQHLRDLVKQHDIVRPTPEQRQEPRKAAGRPALGRVVRALRFPRRARK